MNKLRVEQFGGASRMEDSGEAVDCVMTTVCEDKTLPYVLDVEESGSDPEILVSYGENIFDRFVDFVSEYILLVILCPFIPQIHSWRNCIGVSLKSSSL